MKEKNNNMPDMKQLSETGWKQMHEMLLEHGMSTKIPSPVRSFKKRKWYLVVAAAILLFLIFSSPFILNDKYRQTTINHLNEKAILPVKKEIPVQAAPVTSKPQTPVIAATQKDTAMQRLKTQYLQFRQEQAIATLQDQRKFLIQKFSSDKIANTALPESIGHIDTTAHVNTTLPAAKKAKSNVTGKVQFFAGAGFNISEGNKNSSPLHHFNVHPGFTVLIPLTPKLSLHTGLWAFSTLHKKEVSTKERQPGNMINGNPYDINTTSIVKASYFDLPLTLHYSINQKWSIGSGIQLSKLYKIKIEEKKDSYDNNNMLSFSTTNQYNSTPDRATAIFPKKIEVKKYEPQWVVETSFTHNNWLLSAGYYYGMGNAFTLTDANNISHQYHNDYFKCGIQYRIRWNK